MKTTIGNKVTSVLLIIGVLLSLMLCQMVSAYDDAGDLFVNVEKPYPIRPANGYYEKTEKAYFDGELHYSDVYYNTFDTNGRLTASKVVETRGEGDLLSDHTFYYKYTYDEKGNIIEEDMDGNPAEYEYRSDGSHVIRVHNVLYNFDEAITFDPNLNAYHYGDWKFEFDDKGRKTKMSTINSEGVTYEQTFSYVEDSSGRIIKKLYTTTEDSDVSDSGEVIYSYTNNGRIETRENEYSSLIFTYNANNQLTTISFTSDEDVDNYNLSYDTHGNLILVTGNHTQKYVDENGKTETNSYTTRYEATYETYSRGDSNLNGVVKGPKGWAYYENGKVVTSYTGFKKNKNGWWRIKNGYVDFNANSIYAGGGGKWFKTTGGKVTWNETGFFKNDYGWWYVKDSQVDFKANSIYKSQHGGWFKTTKNKVTWNETGIFKNSYGSWYVKGSKVDFNKNGKVKYNNKTYTIKNGKVV